MEKINLNTAQQQDLTGIKGIGKKLSEAIIRYREANGPFQRLEDVLEVEGITPTLLDNIQASITIVDESSLLQIIGDTRFIGTANSLRTRLEVFNPGERKKRKIEIEVEANAFGGIIGEHGHKFTVRQRINPGQRTDLTFDWPLQRLPAPGSYSGEILIDQQAVPTTFHVVEKVAIVAQPTVLYLKGEAGSTIEKDIVLTNDGNIPFQVSDPGAIIIESDFLECRAIRAVVHKRDIYTGVDSFLLTAAEEMEKLYNEAGALRVRLKEEKFTLEPTQVRKVGLSIKLPSSLRSGVTYQGSIRFCNSLIRLVVMPAAKEVEIH